MMLAVGRSLPAAAAARATAVSASGTRGSSFITIRRSFAGGARVSNDKNAPYGAASAPPLRGPGTASTAKVNPAGKAAAGAGGAGAGAEAGGKAGAAGTSGGGGGGAGKVVGVIVGGLVVATGVGIATKHEAVPPEVYSLLGKVGLELEVPPLKSGEPRREAWSFLKMPTLDKLGAKLPDSLTGRKDSSSQQKVEQSTSAENSVRPATHISASRSISNKPVSIDDARDAALADISDKGKGSQLVPYADIDKETWKEYTAYLKEAGQEIPEQYAAYVRDAAVEAAKDAEESAVDATESVKKSAESFADDAKGSIGDTVSSASTAADEKTASEISEDEEVSEPVTIEEMKDASEEAAAEGEEEKQEILTAERAEEEAQRKQAAVEAAEMMEAADAMLLKKRRIRNEALSKVAEEMEVASAGLKRELEQSMLKDLKNLNDDALRFRVAQLAAEMQERTKWEALRLMEGVKQAEADVARKYENLLNEQKEVFEMERSRALRAQEEKLTEEFTKQYSDQLRHHLQQQAQDFSEALHTKVVAGNDALKAELEAKHADEISAVRAQAAADAEGRIAELQYLREQTERVASALDSAHQFERASEEVHKVAYAALALAERFASSKPIKTELDSLKRLAAGDPLLEEAAKSIPEAAAKKGIPTLSQLRARFGLVKGECRRAALVPATAGDGLGGHLVAAVLSKITFAPRGMVEGTSPEDVLARVDCLLESGELRLAVGELEKLEGLPKETVKDWLADAQTRLRAEEALRVIRCRASMLSAQHLGKA